MQKVRLKTLPPSIDLADLLQKSEKSHRMSSTTIHASYSLIRRNH